MRERIKYLIINADDGNVSCGIARAICELARTRCISSTTIFTNCGTRRYIQAFRKIKELGIGLHFNLSKGIPLSSRKNVASLLDERGLFRRQKKYDASQKKAILNELTAQYREFLHIVKRKPTHIDSHHHVHYNTHVYDVLCDFANRKKVPIRKRLLMGQRRELSARTTDYFLGSLKPQEHWTRMKLMRALMRLKPGTTEIMTHPGFVDTALCRLSSFTKGRECEYHALRSSAVREKIEKNNIMLINFSDLGL